MFEPHKWDVLVRVLNTPGSISGKSVSSKSTKSARTSKSGTEYDLRYKRSLKIWVNFINYSRIGLLARPPWTSRLEDPSLTASPRSLGGQGDTHSTRRGPGAWPTGPGQRLRSTTATCTRRARTQGGQLIRMFELCIVNDFIKGPTAGPHLDTWHLEKMKLRNSKLFQQ